MTESAKGILAMIAACTIWGLSGMYYKLLDHVPPLEVLSHRVLWSFVFFAGVLLVQGRLSALRSALGNRRQAGVLLFATLMISANWFLFITAVQIGKATEASLGYYIFPLITVGLARVIFGERLAPAQVAAIVLATAAVAVLTAGLGVAPWISLVMAGSFAAYGVIKKRLELGPVVSVTAEVLLLVPVALLVVIWTGGAGITGSARDAALLMFSGVLTGFPLILFSVAARRVRLGTVGVLQYINPTLQFMVAVLVFREPFTQWHLIAFALIWTAVAVFSAAALGQERSRSSA